MPSLVPPSVQAVLSAERVSDDAIDLVTITDASIGFTLRLSNHRTQRLSTDPLQYGTISGGQTFFHDERMGAAQPSDKEGSPRTVTLLIDNVDQDRAADIRALTSAARVSIAMALKSAPSTTFRPIASMKIVSRKIDAETVTLELTRQAAEPGNADLSEPWPRGLMTKLQAPGLHR